MDFFTRDTPSPYLVKDGLSGVLNRWYGLKRSEDGWTLRVDTSVFSDGCSNLSYKLENVTPLGFDSSVLLDFNGSTGEITTKFATYLEEVTMTVDIAVY